MSKYFNEIKFTLNKDPAEPDRTPAPNLFDQKKLEVAEKEIQEEFKKIKNGTSNLVTYAINPGGFGFPAANLLRIFMSEPTEKNFKGFIDISKQDFGNLAAERFSNIMNNAREKKNESN